MALMEQLGDDDILIYIILLFAIKHLYVFFKTKQKFVSVLFLFFNFSELNEKVNMVNMDESSQCC